MIEAVEVIDVRQTFLLMSARGAFAIATVLQARARRFGCCRALSTRDLGGHSLRYPLARALGARTPANLHTAASCALRARKGMLIEGGWEPSAGSFFTNPIVRVREAEAVVARAQEAGVIAEPRELPQFDQGDGRVKLSAGWLIERAGIAKGLTRGSVGVSARHALALVHRGGGTTQELLALAAEVQAQVARVFRVELEVEPVRW